MNPSTSSTASAPNDDAVAETETVETPAPDALVEQDLLVEDVSIDGMCGVY